MLPESCLSQSAADKAEELQDPSRASALRCSILPSAAALAFQTDSFHGFLQAVPRNGFPRRRRSRRAWAGKKSERFKVSGPSTIQTLRGELCGRKVALILCGEAHEDALDLTRKGSIIAAKMGWVPLDPLELPRAVDVAAAALHHRGTLKSARTWAEQALARLASGAEAGMDFSGSLLVFCESHNPKDRGNAWLFPPGTLRYVQKAGQDKSTCYFVWDDLDEDARWVRQRKVQGLRVHPSEHDAIVTRRKQGRLEENVELFDDWLLRHASDPRVQLILEGPVLETEVELHEEPGVEPAPLSHRTLQRMELDSCDEEEPEDDGQTRRFCGEDGTGTFLEFLRRRVLQHLDPRRIRFMDPRELGDPDDEELRIRFQSLLQKPMPRDLEEQKADELGLAATKRPMKQWVKQALGSPTVPSWEAFFGASSELLYYSPHIRGDFVPFLACVLKPPEAKRRQGVLLEFFQHLYCGKVSDAFAMLRQDGGARSCLRVRSALHLRPDQKSYKRRQDVRRLIPVHCAPVDRFLKARNSDPPRTWISDLAEQVKKGGAEDVVRAAQSWYLRSVEAFLSNPKAQDVEGDYFVAWLRECHREIHDDIDTSDPALLRSRDRVPSLSNPTKYHNLRGIHIPGFEDAMAEIVSFDPDAGKPTTKRQRVLAKIIIDVFQLRMVDLAAILLVSDRVLQARIGTEVVVILYAGSDHASAVESFFRERGFRGDHLPRAGRVGKDYWYPDEPRGLQLPSYLHDFGDLFSWCNTLASAVPGSFTSCPASGDERTASPARTRQRRGSYTSSVELWLESVTRDRVGSEPLGPWGH
ncbi:hypothetical protein AK812_SmicGene5993 [Symbiodinium microadriaticum]|uniref:Uncharacterized protein n=1 Tax=Symbiodinium microadriaticum TaxID=2951 RepID=A0A1Q9ESA6_SYMMI|nr:hypothetical protein AK812_SmicGene5993 [Symbiodinium microadriaticum]